MAKKKFGILVDTAGGNDPKMYDGTDVSLLPLHIIFKNKAGTEIIDDIKDTPEEIKRTDFYQKLKDGNVDITSSQASPGELMEIYDAMLEKYEHIVHFPIPANLSSMYNTSVMISEDDKYKGKVTVYESAMAANGIKFFALALNKKLNDGSLKTTDEIGKFAKDYEAHMLLDIVPGDPKRLAKGGRAVKVITGVLSFFHTKIMIRWAETPKKDGLSRTIAGLAKIIVKHMKDEYDNKNYEMVFVNTPLTNADITSKAKEVLDNAKLVYKDELIPTLYAVHTGVDTIGFVAVATDL